MKRSSRRCRRGWLSWEFSPWAERTFIAIAPQTARLRAKEISMKKLLRLSAITGIFAVFAFAENYSGRLLDATCIDQGKSKICDPTSTSTHFALNVGGKIYRLDDAGNAKAVEAL